MISRIFLVTAALLPSLVAADEGTGTDHRKFFEMHVRPLLIQHCLECHSAENQ